MEEEWSSDPFAPVPWMRRAACKGHDTEMFFPPKGGDTSRPKAICARCPVQAECLDYGLKDKHGIWGGLTDKQRRVVRRERRQEKAS